MQKKSLLPALIVFIVSLTGVYALTVNLYPSTPSLPRVPTSDGTIGGVIARIIGTTALDTYLGDGTVGNARTLSGVTASGYLRPVSCIAIPGSVMVGIDADGRAICGPKSRLLVGTWSEGLNATRCPYGTPTCSALAVGTPLYEGDIIRTTPTSTGTITFADDLSILRLDTSTTLELQRGTNTAGETVAEAILANGQLWGRIVSNTGVNIGGGGIIAGVRGTSIALTRTADTYTMSIIDSTAASLTPAASLSLDTPPSYADVPFGGGGNSPSRTLYKNRRIIYQSGGIRSTSELFMQGQGAATPLTEYEKSRAYLYADARWIRENTKRDIDYLYTKKSSSLTTIRERATAEYTATLDPTDVPALEGLCKDTSQVYWPSLVGTEQDKCQPKNLDALINYTKPSPTNPLVWDRVMYFSGVGMTISPTGSASCLGGGCKFTNTAHYYLYKNIPSLAGRTVRVTYSATPALSSTTTSILGYTGANVPTPLANLALSQYSAGTIWQMNFPAVWAGDITTGTSVEGKWVSTRLPAYTTNELVIGNSHPNGASPFRSVNIKKVEIFNP